MKMRQLKITQKITNRDGKTLECYLQEVSRERMISPEEEAELSRRIRKGDEKALEQLARANLRFVVSVAKQYQGQGLSLIDLINEGNVGLLTAARRFDETRGFKFISYAIWWIRQSILQALADESRIVRIPLNQIGVTGKVNKFYDRFVQTHERRPSPDEIAEALELDERKVRHALTASGRHVSMDAPLAENDNACLLDLLDCKETLPAERKLRDESLSTEMERALSVLPERERTIVRMYYGIGCPEQGLDEIGTALHLSRERVRQIKENAILALRNSDMQKYLRGFLE